MSFTLKYQPTEGQPEIELPGSKSISNRLLIAQALAKGEFELINLSTAKDTEVLRQSLASDSKTIDVGMAGTAFRFLTAFFAQHSGTRILTGSDRMKQRPIGILVDQLRRLGAGIEYLEKEGFPPLKIEGKQLKSNEINIDASVSSQYISALMLIAPYLENGLQLNLQGEVVSSPYIDLTLSLQQELGVAVERTNNKIVVHSCTYSASKNVLVESDWSSAAFFYQLVAFTGRSIFLKNVKENSLQGDVKCAAIFEQLGVETEFTEHGAILSASNKSVKKELNIDMQDTPDLIPSVVVAASQLVEKITVTGSQTLYIKECNRVEALQLELAKIGSDLEEIDRNSFQVFCKKINPENISVSFSTYDDHRMAMCLAPLAQFANLEMDQMDVVAKSFPKFWLELEKFGITT